MNVRSLTDDLIARSFQGDLSPDERAHLRTWRDAAPENEAHYRALARVWEVTAMAGPAPSRSAPPTLEAVLRAARPTEAGPTPGGGSAPTMVRRHPRRWFVRGVAAAFLLVAGLGAGRFLSAPSAVGGETLGGTEFMTGVAERVTLRLSDGTYTRLGPSSRLRILETPTGREVWLDGSAFFAVAHDPARPFTVRTRSGDAAVLGTRFEVRASEEDLRLVVVEGKVALMVDEARLEVGASQMTTVVGGRVRRVEPVSDVFSLLEGMEGVLLFQDTPLSLVAREMEERFGFHVEVDPRVGATTVTAAFSDEDPALVITAVCRVAAVRCEEVRGGIRVRPGT
jgi:transmembrane sensor